MMKEARVHSFGMADPADVSALATALEAGAIDPAAIVCVIIKTEGNGLDNDWTRVMAFEALSRLLAARGVSLATGDMSCIVSGGCEGVTTPHMTVFERRASNAPAGGASLAIARAVGAPLLPEQIGTLAQVHNVQATVERALDQAQLTASEVEYVQVKAPWLLDHHQIDARSRAAITRAADAHGSKPWTRAACALGVALALKEVVATQVLESSINADWSLFTRRAAVTAGNDHLQCEVVVFGMSKRWTGGARVAHGCLKDLLDSAAIDDTARRAGLPPGRGTLPTAVLFKGDPARSGLLRGERQVMWHDSDVHPLRHLRAVMSGVIGAAIGSTRIFVSAGAEHQGPQGGGTLAVFAEPSAPRP